MKIKNIQQYRSIYKNEVRKMPDRDENFIGNFFTDQHSRKTKGWFDLYFGDTDGSSTAQNGVKNKLKSFLDMAKDGQAVYEFLQNAVDAGGTQFLMFYKKDEATDNDYLLVINNGEMFNPASIRSILNIGSSTKANTSDKIGQFGIGFKLAHRLVGKDDALDELVNHLNGPILYSWKNSEILDFRTNVIIEDLKYNVDVAENINLENTTPWLFKILLTTFPCAYGEVPTIWEGQKANLSPFGQEDLSILSNWLKEEHVARYLKNNFEEGALFLMKLGDGKLNELREEPNLNLGVKFSLAVLKETSNEGKALQTAVINGEEVHHPDLQFHKFTITKKPEDLDDYSFIRFKKHFSELSDNEKETINTESEIEILFGFRKFNQIGNYFKGSPSFYLYFPVSQEVHNFNFIFHSNALYKGSSRVFLQSGGGVGLNERLFSKVIERIEIELKTLFLSDQNRFFDLYASFLTSGETHNNESRWITDCFTHPLNNLLNKLVPVKNHNDEISLLDLSTVRNIQVYILDSKIKFEGNHYYFYFDDQEENTDIVYKAVEKLSLKKYNIFDILQNDSAYIEINRWLEKDENRIFVFLHEITEKINSLSGLSETQKNNLIRIKWIKFTDNVIRSIEEIGDNPYILLNDRTYGAKEVFNKAGLTTSSYNVNNFIEKFRSNFQQNELKQFLYTNFTRTFSNHVSDEKLDSLTNEEKFILFEVFRKLDDTPGERIRFLKIYKNNLGIYQPFGKMLNLQGGLAGLLSIDAHQLQGIENINILLNYLKTDPANLYERIYYPQWCDVLNHISVNTLNVEKIKGEIDYAFKHSNWEEKERKLLSDYDEVIFGKRIIRSKYIFIPQKKIENLSFYQENLLKYFGAYIPDEEVASLFSSNLPFGYKSELKDPELLLNNISKEEILNILELAKVLELDFFEYNTIISNGKNYDIISGYITQQFYSEKNKIIDFFNQQKDSRYRLLPEELNSYSSLIHLKEQKFNTEITEFFAKHKNIDTVATEAMDIIVSFDEDSRVKLFESMHKIELNSSVSDEINQKHLLFLQSLNNLVDLDSMQSKIYIISESQHIPLEDVLPQTPNLLINKRLINFSDIFSEEIGNNKSVGIFYDKFINGTTKDQSFFKKLFKLDSIEDLTSLKPLFLNQLKDENEISTIYQLYFLLFSNVFSEKEISSLYILNADNEYSSLDSSYFQFSEENNKFFISGNLIHESFNNEPLLLDDIITAQFNIEFTLSSKFRLTKSSDFTVLKKELRTIEKIDFLYSAFLNTTGDLQYIHDDLASEYLELSSEQKLLNSLSSFENNDFIEAIHFWSAKDESKQNFLKKVGFRFDDDPTVQLINRIKASSNNFSDINVFSFSDEELNLLYDYLVKNQIKFTLGNENLIKIVMQLYTAFSQNSNKKIALIYSDSKHIIFDDTEDIWVFNYDIIEQVFENTDYDLLLSFLTEYKIIYKEIANDVLTDNEIDIYYTIVEESTEILNDYFYTEWKKEIINIEIYQANELEYTIKVKINHQIVKLCTVKYTDDTWLEQKGIKLHIYYTTDKSLKYVVDHYSSAQFEGYANYNLKNALKKLEESYNTVNATISEALKNLDHSEIKEILQTQIEKEERKLERESIVTEIKENIKYSKEWFLKYLEYLNTVNEKNTSSENKTLRFKEFNKTTKAKFYKLSACNSAIPENIDESKDVTIKFYYGKNIKTAKISSISQKNQRVLIHIDEPLPNEIFESFFMAEITYQPTIDLLQRLRNAFAHLDTWDDIETEFPAIQYIYGPPGTGKTTTLKDKIKTLYKENPNVKILVLAPTNKACDVLAEKLYEDKFRKFIRLSGTTSETLPESFYSNELNRDELYKGNVIISTIHRHSYFKISTEHSLFFMYDLEEFWDYVIIDEASMINLPYITFSAIITSQKNTSSELIIAGDPKQIPPVPELSDNEREEIDIETENIYSMFGLRSFNEDDQKEEIRDIDTVKNLMIQYRSVPEIGNLFSHFSYEGNVSSERTSESKRELPSKITQILDSPITFLDIPLEKDNQLFSINKLIYSSYHLYSCILVNEFIQYFDRCNDKNEKWTIGIISPYKAQAVLCNRLNAGLTLKTDIQVIADTVHGFQGDECDIIFYISNPSSYLQSPHPKSLLANDFIYNVAVSRARDYLIIVNPFNTLHRNYYINKIKSIAADFFMAPIRIKSSSHIEKILFNNSSYIDDNTFITNHDDVNIYGADIYKYFIKKNSVSIDFQISTK